MNILIKNSDYNSLSQNKRNRLKKIKKFLHGNDTFHWFFITSFSRFSVGLLKFNITLKNIKIVAMQIPTYMHLVCIYIDNENIVDHS